MTIAFYCDGDDGTILQAVRNTLPAHTIIDWQGTHSTQALSHITSAIVWKPPATFFDQLPNIRDIHAFSAGVDHLLEHPKLPTAARIIRLRDAGMAQQMCEYALYGVLHFQRHMERFRQAKTQRSWSRDVEPLAASSISVGILGAGVLGRAVAQRLALNGYSVSCWSRSPHDNNHDTEQFSLVHGQHSIGDFLARSQVIVCLLPLTDATRGILNRQLFRQLPHGAFLINIGRGGHLVENDLLEALNSEQLSGAMLDVFSTEPLPEQHPFWEHPNVIITPHIAAQSLVEESVQQIAGNILAIEKGLLPDGIVDRHTGY